MRFALLLLTIGLSGCAAVCPLPGQQAMVLIRFYFGRDIPARGPLNEAEWRAFVASEIAPRFPDGFTIFDASGEWRNPSTGAAASEATKLVEVATASKDFAEAAEAVIAAYRRDFHQAAVGRVTMPVCAGF